MANTTHAHTEHVLPLRLYFGVFGALLVLTAITVYIASLNFGAFNLVVAMSVAAIKASLVALFFMHLKYDNKVYLVIFITSIAFLAIFIIFTMADTLTRGRVDPMKEAPLVPEATIYRGRGAQEVPPEVQGMVPDTAALQEQGDIREHENILDTIPSPEGEGVDSVPIDVLTDDTASSADTAGR